VGGLRANKFEKVLKVVKNLEEVDGKGFYRLAHVCTSLFEKSRILSAVEQSFLSQVLYSPLSFGEFYKFTIRCIILH